VLKTLPANFTKLIAEDTEKWGKVILAQHQGGFTQHLGPEGCEHSGQRVVALLFATGRLTECPNRVRFGRADHLLGARIRDRCSSLSGPISVQVESGQPWASRGHPQPTRLLIGSVTTAGSE
jgi:hypothetical protein